MQTRQEKWPIFRKILPQLHEIAIICILFANAAEYKRSPADLAELLLCGVVNNYRTFLNDFDDIYLLGWQMTNI